MADRGSATALVAAWHAVLGTGIAELLLAPSLWREPAWAPAVGLALVVAGVALRLSAVATLDEHFSPLVELREGHRLVTGGLYAHMRHPAYLGSACWVASLPLLLGSGVAAAVALATYVPALAWRVRVEEQVLAAAFGDAWSAYRAAVPALLPRIRAWRGPGDPPPAC
jgi:protein-S-isoprenylcysteine O-methyltransferase